jgi:hypothetical protein
MATPVGCVSIPGGMVTWARVPNVESEMVPPVVGTMPSCTSDGLITSKVVGKPSASSALMVYVARFLTASFNLTTETLHVPDSLNCGTKYTPSQVPLVGLPKTRLKAGRSR